MKVKCTCPRGGYEHILTVGKEYEVIDIQDGIFDGDYYVVVIGDNDVKATAYYWRFNITKGQAKDYVNNVRILNDNE